jgi:hypothetical protein
VKLKGMIGAVSDKNDGLIQISVEGSQHRQTRGARQGQSGLRAAGLDRRENRLICRKRMDLFEEEFHDRRGGPTCPPISQMRDDTQVVPYRRFLIASARRAINSLSRS